MKYLLTTAIIVLNTIVLFAQSDFREGYIITNTDTKIMGLINYKENKANAKTCVYKKTKNTPSKTYTPEQIKGYRFTDSKYYVTRTVKIGNETKKVFLEYLINGVVDIYFYSDSYSKRFLLDNGNGKLIELKDEKKEIEINDVKYVKESKEYIGLLKATFKESPTIYKKVEGIGLYRKALINITHDYHNEVCSDQECIIYEKKIPKAKSTFGFVLGVSNMSFKKSGEATDLIENSDFGNSTSPTIGLYYKINLPFISERAFLQYEGTFSRVSYGTNTMYTEPIYSFQYIHDLSFKQNTLNNLLLIKYEIPTSSKINPTFQLGAFYKYHFNTEYNDTYQELYSWGATIREGSRNNSPFENKEFGINLGIGLTTNYIKDKELYLDFRYQTGYGITEGLNTNTLVLSLGLQVGK